MKRKIVFLVTLALVVVSAGGVFAVSDGTDTKTTLAFEKVDFSEATVTASVLNVRQGPSTSYSSICKLEKGQSVKVLGKIGDWYAVYDSEEGMVGAVDSRYIKAAGAADPSSAKAKTPAKTTPETTPSKTTPSKTPAKTTSSVTTDKPDAIEAAAPADLTQDEQSLLKLVNKARKDAGVEALTFDKELMKIARMKAKDMVDNGYFSHQSPTYGSPFDMMRQFSNVFKTAGENIAGNQTVDGAFKAWMGSEGHKKNILNNSFNLTGIGIETSKTYGKILVQQFIGQ